MSDPSDNPGFFKKFRMPILAFVGLTVVLGYLAVDEGWFAPSYAPPPPSAAAPPPVPTLPQPPALPPLPTLRQAAPSSIGAILAAPSGDSAAPAQTPAIASSTQADASSSAPAKADETSAPSTSPPVDAVKAPPPVDRSMPSSTPADDDIRRRQAQNAQLTLEAARLSQEAAIEETRLRIARARNEMEKLKSPPAAPPLAALPIVAPPLAAPASQAREAQEASPRFYLLALRAGPDGVKRATVAADGGRYDVAKGGVLPGGWSVEAIGAASITLARAGARGAPARRATIDLAAPATPDAPTFSHSSPAPVGALPVLPIAPGFVGGRP